MGDTDARPHVHLRRGDDRADDVEALVAAITGGGGARVGLGGVLRDLDRRAEAVRVPAPAATWGFRWERSDRRSRRWWPQGITTSADATDPELYDGRSVLVTSAYSHDLDGAHHGSRLSLVDLTDRDEIRYRNVLLVEPVRDAAGGVDLRPVKVHAGGIVWHGDHLHVAGTARGFSSFRLDDVLRLPGGQDRRRIGVAGGRVDAFGYRYVLPVRFTYDAHAAEGVPRMRYSFASVDRSTSPAAVVVGEYGRGSQTTRLARFDLDPETSLLHAEDDGSSYPAVLEPGGVPGMQGATVVDGRWFVTTSRGRYRLGSVWSGRPGHLVEHRHQLPVGPEDVCYWPSRDELWSLSEYPGARYVFAMPRERFAG